GSAGSAGTAGSAGAGVPLNQLASSLATALCADLTACYSSAIKLVIHDEDCVQYFTKTLTDTTVATIQSSVDATPARLSYDPSKAAQCIMALTAASQQSTPSCADVGAMIEGCKSALTGAGAPGAPCNNLYECQAGS